MRRIRTALAVAIAVALAGCGDDGGALGGWALGFGGAGTDAPNAIAAAPGGGVVVTGLFSQTAGTGDVSITSSNAWDAFVLFVDADGMAVWAESLGGTGDDLGQSLAVDVDGEVVVIGTFAEKITLGDDTLSTTGGTDVFVARLDAGGAPVWLTAFGGPNDDAGRAIAFADNGDILVAGDFTDNLSLGGTNLEGQGGTDAFYARLGADGSPVWVKAAGGRGADSALALAASPDGGFALAGQFEGDLQIGAQQVSSKGSLDVYLAGFNAAGDPLWSRGFGGANDDLVRALAISPDGALAAIGEADGDIDFGSGSQSTNTTDAYVASFDAATGTPAWARLITGSGFGTGRSVAFDADGNLDVAGSFTESVSLDGCTATSAGASDVVAAQLDPAGNCLWLQRFGGPANDSATAVTVDTESPTPAFAGTFEDTGNFAYAALTSAGARDIFLLTLPQQ